MLSVTENKRGYATTFDIGLQMVRKCEALRACGSIALN